MAKISLNIKQQNREQALFSQSPNLTYKTHIYMRTCAPTINCLLLNKEQLNHAFKWKRSVGLYS